MKNQNLKAKNLYTEADMNYNFKSAVLQGIVMCITALEWHYGWRGKRLTDLYENTFVSVKKCGKSLSNQVRGLCRSL